MSELISVIVPVYQTNEYLDRCIESIIQQEYKNIEIILIDDGSTDGSEKKCDEYANKDVRVKVIHEENRGLSHARNKGIDVAMGEYISFVDSDDIIHEKFLSYLYDLCKKNNADISQCDFLMVRDEKDIISYQKIEHINVYKPAEIMSKTYSGFESVRYIVSWNKLYRKSIFSEIRFPEGKLHEDAYTSHKLFMKAKKIVVSNLYLYYYIQRDNSIIGKKYSIARLDSVEASRQKCLFFKETTLEKEYYEMLIQHYYNIWRNYNLANSNLEGIDDILESLQEEAKNIENELMSINQGTLLEKLRIIYPYLSSEEQKISVKKYGKRITYKWDIFFRFPFEFIPKGARIVIYGAGGVGKSYYEQIKDTEYCHLVVWVDNLWNNYVKEGFDVKPIKELFKYEYDYIILAVRDEKIAEEIRENLVSWGCDYRKILWKYPDDRGESRKVLISDTEKISRSIHNKIFIMNTADYGNIGDQILAIKAKLFFENYFPQYEIIDVTGRQWDVSKDKLSNIITEKDIVVFVGGGYMGDLWQIENNRVMEIIQKFNNNKIIFLPQSFYYNSELKNTVLHHDKQIFENNGKILFIHREKNSYNLLKNKVLSLDNHFLFPDMALYDCKPFNKISKSGVLGCFRLDKEKINCEINQRVYNICSENNIQYEVIDTLVDHSIMKNMRDNELNELLNVFSKAELVITDRLHGMLFSAIVGTSCIALDNVSHKISGVYKWIEDWDYIKLVTNMDDIENTLESMLKDTKKDNYINCERINNRFYEMAQLIRKWCETI